MTGSGPRRAGLAILAGDPALIAPTGRELAALGFDVSEVPGAAADARRLAELIAEPRTTVVVVATRDDALALRLALLVADRRPDLRLVVTIFDKAVAAELRAGGLRATIVRPAGILGATIAGPCANPEVDVLRRTPGGTLEDVSQRDGRVLRRAHRVQAPERVRHGIDRLVGGLRPYDVSARILVLGLAGLLTMLTIDVVIGLTQLHESFLQALLHATWTVATVQGNDEIGEAASLVQVISIFTMLGTLASVALFSAGLVSRVVEPRHVGIIGRRALPRRDHVVIVGMGQIGLRTALLLRDARIPVVGIDRDDEAVGVRLGRRYGLPVIIAEGGDREVLRRVHGARARCVAAVTSDDVVNVEVALAARALHPDLRVVLRAGDGEVARETRSLLHLGVVRDAHRLIAIALASAALGEPVETVLPADAGTAWLVDEVGVATFWPPPHQT